MEQTKGDAGRAWLGRAANHGTERLDAMPMAVFRADRLQPRSRVRQKVAEAPLRLVERGMREGEVACREPPHLGEIAGATVLQTRHQLQPTCVVVETIAFVVTRDAERRVLQQSGVVAERAEMPKIEARQAGQWRDVDAGAGRVPRGARMLAQRALERGDVLHRHRWPEHRATVHGRALTQGLAAGRVGKQGPDRECDGHRIPWRHEDATVGCQQLAGVHVGSRDHGAP